MPTPTVRLPAGKWGAIRQVFWSIRHRWRAKRGHFSNVTAISWFGGPIVLRERVCGPEWLLSVFSTADPDHKEVVKYFNLALSPSPNRPDQIIFSTEGIFRTRRALWSDLGYKGAPDLVKK